MTRYERGPGDPPAQSWIRAWMSDSAQLLGSQALTVIATSIAAITIARTLEPEDWAVFSAFLGLSMALALVADFGISTWLLRELSGLVAGRQESDGSERIGRLVTSGVVLNAVIALPLLVAAAIWSAFARPGSGATLALMSLLAYGALTTSANALESHLRARREVRLVLSASLLEKSALIVLVLVVASVDLGVGAIGLAYLGAGVLRVAFDAVVVFLRRRVPFRSPSLRYVVDIARTSAPFALNAASLNLVPRLDTLVLAAMSTTSAAWFAIGDRVLGPALFIPGTLASALYPFMATHAARRSSPWRLAGGLGLFGLALAGVAIVLAPFLIPWLFGAAYEDAVPVAQVMLLMLPLVYAASPLLVVAYSYGWERSLQLPVLVLSLAGTVAIVIGQAAGGATFAAVGFVARSALFLLVIGTVSFIAWRRHTAVADLGDLPTAHRVSAQSP